MIDDPARRLVSIKSSEISKVHSTFARSASWINKRTIKIQIKNILPRISEARDHVLHNTPRSSFRARHANELVRLDIDTLEAVNELA